VVDNVSADLGRGSGPTVGDEAAQSVVVEVAKEPVAPEEDPPIGSDDGFRDGRFGTDDLPVSRETSLSLLGKVSQRAGNEEPSNSSLPPRLEHPSAGGPDPVVFVWY